jgi:hypothetical protein
LAALRADDGCADTDDNAADFTAAAQIPRNSASATHTCAGSPSPGNAFSPRDLPLALAAAAPTGASLGPPFAGGSLVPIPVPPAAVLTVGTKDAPSAGSGDVWASRIGFSAPLPLVPTGRYSATVTFNVIAR